MNVAFFALTRLIQTDILRLCKKMKYKIAYKLTCNNQAIIVATLNVNFKTKFLKLIYFKIYFETVYVEEWKQNHI